VCAANTGDDVNVVTGVRFSHTRQCPAPVEHVHYIREYRFIFFIQVRLAMRGINTTEGACAGLLNTEYTVLWCIYQQADGRTAARCFWGFVIPERRVTASSPPPLYALL